MTNIIQGTIAQLVARNLKINGVKGDQPYLSFLARIGAFKIVGNVEDGKKGRGGKTATIYEIEIDKPISMAVMMTVNADTTEAIAA